MGGEVELLQHGVGRGMKVREVKSSYYSTEKEGELREVKSSYKSTE